jgi:hypothetical protein
MIKLNDSRTIWIDSGKISALMQIAVLARVRQISEIIGAAMFSGDDVLDVECVYVVVLVQPTVFATVSCSDRHSQTNSFIH